MMPYELGFDAAFSRGGISDQVRLGQSTAGRVITLRKVYDFDESDNVRP
jgi:hypothetical protein